MKNKYGLRYLPLFYDDLEQAVTYISESLHNASAAGKLLDAVETAIQERLPSAESFEQYHSVKDRTYPYYRIYVGHYVIYYVVLTDEKGSKVMEVRRFLYGGRDRESIL